MRVIHLDVPTLIKKNEDVYLTKHLLTKQNKWLWLSTAG